MWPESITKKGAAPLAGAAPFLVEGPEIAVREVALQPAFAWRMRLRSRLALMLWRRPFTRRKGKR